MITIVLAVAAAVVLLAAVECDSRRNSREAAAEVRNGR